VLVSKILEAHREYSHRLSIREEEWDEEEWLDVLNRKAQDLLEAKNALPPELRGKNLPKILKHGENYSFVIGATVVAEAMETLSYEYMLQDLYDYGYLITDLKRFKREEIAAKYRKHFPDRTGELYEDVVNDLFYFIRILHPTVFLPANTRHPLKGKSRKLLELDGVAVGYSDLWDEKSIELLFDLSLIPILTGDAYVITEAAVFGATVLLTRDKALTDTVKALIKGVLEKHKLSMDILPADNFFRFRRALD